MKDAQCGRSLPGLRQITQSDSRPVTPAAIFLALRQPLFASAGPIFGECRGRSVPVRGHWPPAPPLSSRLRRPSRARRRGSAPRPTGALPRRPHSRIVGGSFAGSDAAFDLARAGCIAATGSFVRGLGPVPRYCRRLRPGVRRLQSGVRPLRVPLVEVSRSFNQAARSCNHCARRTVSVHRRCRKRHARSVSTPARWIRAHGGGADRPRASQPARTPHRRPGTPARRTGTLLPAVDTEHRRTHTYLKG